MIVENNSKQTVLPWLKVFTWMALIFLFSSQPHSGAITETYFGSWNILIRKTAHVSEYALLCLLSQRAFHFSGRIFSAHSVIFAFLLTVLYAGFDEWHQSFVPGRSASMQDVLVDALGGLLAILWLAFLRRSNCEKR